MKQLQTLLPEYERFEKYNRTTQEYEPVTYTVVEELDHEKPQLSENSTQKSIHPKISMLDFLHQDAMLGKRLDF